MEFKEFEPGKRILFVDDEGNPYCGVVKFYSLERNRYQIEETDAAGKPTGIFWNISGRMVEADPIEEE